jgi:hypothetical protein
MNQRVGYTGAAVSLYTRMGTHIVALNHFGLDGKIWNGFERPMSISAIAGGVSRAPKRFRRSSPATC